MKKLKADEVDYLRKVRWRCRVDLQFLAAEILGYKDVENEFHGPLMATLQQFERPTANQALEYDAWNGKTWIYRPLVPMLRLPGHRRRLILDSRSSLKTTINTQSHTIQWLINYPNLAIAVFQSNLDKAIEIVKAIKGIFQYNTRFREVFPEFCPWKGIDNWGTQQQFTVECRDKTAPIKESSVTALALGAGTAGKHFDVMKFSDIVEPENTRGQDRMTATKEDFYMAEHLLVTVNHWIDVEGTRYKFGDLYGDIIDKYLKDKKEGIEPEYRIFARGCFKKKTPDGSPQKFTPEELDNETYPFLLDANGKRITHWPFDKRGETRQDIKKLEQMEQRDVVGFNSQQLNNPIGGDAGVLSFPVSPSRPAIISRKDYENNVAPRLAYKTITIDTAHSQKRHSKYTSICVAAWDWDNRCYIEEIQHGKWLPLELIERFVAVIDRHRPKSKENKRFEVFMEKIPFNEFLYLHLQDKMKRANWNVPVVFLPRSNDVSKEDRIHAALNPYYNTGKLRFVADLGHRGATGEDAEAARIWEHMRKELKEFPTGVYKDILDSIADQFYGKEDQMGRLIERPQENEQVDILNYLALKDMGFEDIAEALPGARWAVHFSTGQPENPHYSRTGGL